MQGQVATSTHAGLPWLLWLRMMFEAKSRIHFWPFDGFDVPEGKSVIYSNSRFVKKRNFTHHLCGHRFEEYLLVYVSEILEHARRAFVRKEKPGRYHGRRLIGKAGLESFRPSFLEFDAVNLRDSVDADWCNTNLKNQSRPNEIF